MNSNCYNTSCPFRNNDTISSTYCACYACPNRESQDYIVITTDHFVETTEKVENMNKPLKDWTLGEVKKLCAETGMDCEKCPFSVKNEVPPSCRLENDPPDNWDLSERPRWTERDKEDAMMIKRVFNGFQIGIARDTLAQLRTFAKDDYPSEYINSDMFPSLKPGESVTLDEIIGANNADNI